jgi:hypothetical protein
MVKKQNTDGRLKVVIASTFLVLAGCRAVTSSDVSLDADSRIGQLAGPSADDCEILVEIGNSKMQWHSEHPLYQFYPATYPAQGGEFLSKCPWSKFGIPDYDIGTSAAQATFAISPPAYDRTRATVYVYMRSMAHGYVEFFEGDRCVLEKRNGDWHLEWCETESIS